MHPVVAILYLARKDLRLHRVTVVVLLEVQLGSGSDDNITRALRRGSQDSVNRAGEQIVSRELQVRPTITIRPGYPVRVLVTRDLVLAPYGQGVAAR